MVELELRGAQLLPLGLVLLAQLPELETLVLCLLFALGELLCECVVGALELLHQNVVPLSKALHLPGRLLHHLHRSLHALDLVPVQQLGPLATELHLAHHLLILVGRGRGGADADELHHLDCERWAATLLLHRVGDTLECEQPDRAALSAADDVVRDWVAGERPPLAHQLADAALAPDGSALDDRAAQHDADEVERAIALQDHLACREVVQHEALEQLERLDLIEPARLEGHGRHLMTHRHVGYNRPLGHLRQPEGLLALCPRAPYGRARERGLGSIRAHSAVARHRMRKDEL